MPMTRFLSMCYPHYTDANAIVMPYVSKCRLKVGIGSARYNELLAEFVLYIRQLNLGQVVAVSRSV